MRQNRRNDDDANPFRDDPAEQACENRDRDSDDEELPEGAAQLLEQRAAARAARDYVTSDRLRDELTAMGVEVRDTATGQEAKRRR